MRKRSEVASAPVEQVATKMKQQTIPGTEDAPKSEPRPKAVDATSSHYVARADGSAIEGVTFDRGIYFVKCSACELNLSIESGRTLKGFACIRCGENLDPKGEFESLLARGGKGAPPPALKKDDGPQPDVAVDETGNDIPVCETCKQPLSETGVGLFYPCGHDKRKSAKETPSPAPATKEMKLDPVPPKKNIPSYEETIAKHRASEAARNEASIIASIESYETVTVVHGEELFTPRQFNSFRNGPFTWSTRIMEGETPGQALERAQFHLEEHANREFERKATAFLKRLAWLVSQVGDK